MSNERDELEFVERVRTAWGRPELTARERAELDDDLRERVRAPQPRRWALALGAATAMAAVALVVLSVREPTAEAAGWLDELVEAQAVVQGEHAYSDTFYSGEAFAPWKTDTTETDDTETQRAADPVWDLSADEAWDSSDSLELGYEYEVLAYWVASPTNDGDSAEKDTGAATPTR